MDQPGSVLAVAEGRIQDSNRGIFTGSAERNRRTFPRRIPACRKYNAIPIRGVCGQCASQKLIPDPPRCRVNRGAVGCRVFVVFREKCRRVVRVEHVSKPPFVFREIALRICLNPQDHSLSHCLLASIRQRSSLFNFQRQQFRLNSVKVNLTASWNPGRSVAQSRGGGRRFPLMGPGIEAALARGVGRISAFEGGIEERPYPVAGACRPESRVARPVLAHCHGSAHRTGESGDDGRVLRPARAGFSNAGLDQPKVRLRARRESIRCG